MLRVNLQPQVLEVMKKANVKHLRLAATNEEAIQLINGMYNNAGQIRHCTHFGDGLRSIILILIVFFLVFLPSKRSKRYIYYFNYS